jgi:hypothetical protein
MNDSEKAGRLINRRWVTDARAEGGGLWVDTLVFPSTPTRSKKQKPFKIDFVKLPDYWIRQLEQTERCATYKLAHRILREAYKQQFTGDEIVLSAAVTGLPGTTRRAASRELIALKLIEIQQNGRRAPRVIKLWLEPPKAESSLPKR